MTSWGKSVSKIWVFIKNLQIYLSPEEELIELVQTRSSLVTVSTFYSSMDTCIQIIISNRNNILLNMDTCCGNLGPQPWTWIFKSIFRWDFASSSLTCIIYHLCNLMTLQIGLVLSLRTNSSCAVYIFTTWHYYTSGTPYIE